MDQSIRNKLRSVVTQCRKLLEEAVSQVLQGQFGIYASGKKDEVHVEDEGRMKNLSDEDKGYRRDIQAHLGHIEALGYQAKDALAQLVREIAFTHLNRLCAYKMMEAREVWLGGQRFRESVSRGMKSQGFQFYLADHADEKKLFDAGHQDLAYRHFLGWLGVLLSDEIGVLFSPTDPANRLFPPQRVLDGVLDLLNSEDLAGIWDEDETIGWVYQYFTPKELRDQVRKESAAPRNSYELAFRNQFFTPRYVVEFLTDNTLGRIWYEMRQGDTKLNELCRYMVRRPSEVFLADGQTPPEPTPNHDELSQEDLLKQPVNIPHRPKKDPRELRILDPACGSGHFLLYCFDLLLTIYEEAYADPDIGPKLKEEYPTLDDLRRDVPRLILAHNLHGIDIDLRCTQIAALALWLRCQRTYRELGLMQNRPKITKSNIVCAEPMPGEQEILDEFLKTLMQDRLEALIGRVMKVPEGSRVRATEAMVESLTELLRLIWDKMQLAGEAGSLLKIEEELQEAIRRGQKEWEEKQPLFRFTEFSLTDQPKESYVHFVPGEGASFWQRAEALVLEALRDYAWHAATNGGRLQRQLFADDAAQGFAFIDTCQKRFDVVLMNPPFGTSSKPSKSYIEKSYERTKRDLYAAFVERGVGWLLSGGRLGAISSRTGFFLSSFDRWREEILLDEATTTVFADLGFGVLDTAMVETAAYCLGTNTQYSPTAFFRLLNATDKASSLLEATHLTTVGQSSNDTFFVPPADLKIVPGSPFAYWVGNRIRSLFSRFSPFENSRRRACITNPAGDDQRYFRCYWEVPAVRIGRKERWVPITRGGRFNPFYSDVQQVVDWDDGEQTYRGFTGTFHRPMKRPASLEHFFKPGLTWPLRGIHFSCQALPKGCIFSVAGKFATSDDQEELPILLGLMNSTPFDFLIGFFAGKVGGVQYEVGLINKVPVPDLSSQEAKELGRLAVACHHLARSLLRSEETNHAFEMPQWINAAGNDVSQKIKALSETLAAGKSELQECHAKIDKLAYSMYGLGDEERQVIETWKAGGATVQAGADDPVIDEEGDIGESEEQGGSGLDAAGSVRLLASYAVGCNFGRWDIRFVTVEKQLHELPSPFDPLPNGPPGMLVGINGHSLHSPSEYPLRIDADGIIPDDPDHLDDIVRRVGEILALIWKDRAEAIEKEACEILGVKELRDYFRKPGKSGFWDDHVSRYSKSRRKAPIYWLLQSSKKNYGLWLYYHRLDKDILFKARQNYVDPKIRLEQTRLGSLRTQKAELGADAKGVKKIDKEIEKQETLLGELKDFAEKLERAAKLNFGNAEKLNSEVVYDPDLNDGVVLNIAPLWELVPWKEAKNYWEELLEGKYEWSSMGKLLRKKGLVK